MNKNTKLQLHRTPMLMKINPVENSHIEEKIDVFHGAGTSSIANSEKVDIDMVVADIQTVVDDVETLLVNNNIIKESIAAPEGIGDEEVIACGIVETSVESLMNSEQGREALRRGTIR